MNRLSRTPSLTTLLVVVILLAAGSAVAASGVSTLVSTPDDSAATAKAAQQPLGTLSATPPVTQIPESVGAGAVKDTDPVSGGPTDPNVVPGQGADPAGGSSGAGSLPFTGFLAIPVLLLGAGLLVAGAFTRRRSAALPA